MGRQAWGGTLLVMHGPVTVPAVNLSTVPIHHHHKT
jgi:hypothetical protein